jgi:hypothetical protein
MCKPLVMGHIIELMVDWQMVWIGIILISDTSSIGFTMWVPLFYYWLELGICS